MSKRRINKQQSKRIELIQASYQQPSNSDQQDNYAGLVIMRHSRHAVIEDEQGNRIHSSIRPHIDSLVAGDRVIWQKEGDNQGIVVSRLDRQSELGKVDGRGNVRAVAANITQLIAVFAPKPAMTWPLLDNYTIIAELLGLRLLIVLNKTDLHCDDIKIQLQNIYQKLDYRVLYTNNQESQSYLCLEDCLKNEVSVFVGQSGVGKSSLISTILPHEDTIITGEISASSELGCHTTSNSRYYHLPNGGALIDSPGVREFSLGQLAKKDTLYGFREFRRLAHQCKFRNCNHLNSPGCEILRSVESGENSSQRYDNFIKLYAQVVTSQ